MELARKLPFIADDTGLGCMAHGLYTWQLDFIESLKRFLFLCAANQIGKSAANWIRLLRFVYLQSYWDKFFQGVPPLPFWYFYPNLGLSTSEIKTKYLRFYLPHPDLKKHKRWGYRIEEEKRVVNSIHFNTGCSVWFKSYSQPPSNLQSATLSGVFNDEEMPRHLFDELNFRGISRDDFYFHNVFTATLGQEYLRRTIEERGERELFKNAFKRQISMYDCLTYADGKPSKIWTLEKIAEAKANCTSEAEVQRRVYGRFVLSDDLKFHAFDHERNTAKGHVIPSSWLIYGGIDWGSGSKGGHPSALIWLAVSPDFKKGRVFQTWRGDGIPTTQGDLVSKYLKLSKGLSMIEAAYDYSAADIGLIASRMGIPLTKANKAQEKSVELINTLFKNGQLVIYLGDGYEANEKLVSEIVSCSNSGAKVRDDLIDALRYCVNLVPWQYEIQNEIEEKIEQSDKEKKLSARERFWKYGDETGLFEYDAIEETIQYYQDIQEMYEI